MTTSGTGEAEALKMLGLARRAGSVAPGASATRDALRRGRARLVLTARDASEAQLQKVEKLLGSVPRRILGSRDALGRALGEASLTAVAVVDRGMAEAILRRLDASGSAGRSGMSRERAEPDLLEDNGELCG